MARYSFKDGKTYKDGVEVDLSTKRPDSVGMGDLVAGAAKSVGIEPSPGCGCKRRQELLNRWTPGFVARMLDRLRGYWPLK